MQPLSIPTSSQSPTLNICIRPANYTDLPAILEIYNDAVIHTTASYDYNPTTLEARTVWYEEHLNSKLPIFVAELEGCGVVGWSSLSSFRRADGYCFTAEDSIYVAANQRGRGIGKRLLLPLIDVAEQLGLHSIIAGIDADNAVSIHIHAAVGFEQVAYMREVAFKFDRWLDLVLMQRILR